MKTQIFLALTTILGSSIAADPFMGESYKSGLVEVKKNGDDLFYWLFNSRRDPSKDPLVLWLTGGPGCASETAIMYENGPFKFKDPKAPELEKNNYSWNEVANVVYVDSPIGTGYSKSKGIFDDDTNEKEISEHMLTLIQGFIEQNKQFEGRDFYITGESYAGHYIPAIANYFVKQKKDLPVNMKGIAIGNGWVNPKIQYPQYAEFSKENNLISNTEYWLLKGGFKVCDFLIDTGIWPIALEACNIGMATILGNPVKPKFNVYDIRKKCDYPPLCYDMGESVTYFNSAEIQDALGVKGRKWTQCNMVVHTDLLGDWMKNLEDDIPEVLEAGVEVLVYSGDKDFVCNWFGGRAWTDDVKWSGKSDFNKAEFKDWTVNGKAAGQLKEYKNFKFLRVYDAGHMVPMDQPENALNMLSTFITGELEREGEVLF